MHLARLERKEGMIPASSNIFSCAELVASLSYNNGTRLSFETWKELDPQSSTSRVTTIATGTSRLFGGCSDLLMEEWRLGTSLCEFRRGSNGDRGHGEDGVYYKIEVVRVLSVSDDGEEFMVFMVAIDVLDTQTAELASLLFGRTHHIISVKT